MTQHNYFVYITTNTGKSTLYVGMTNNLPSRLIEHHENKGKSTSFAGKYRCYHLVWYERHQFVQHAIDREKEIKKWRREKKEELIRTLNPDWKFLNEEVG